ncbi:NACHT domain-containing protein [Streptomyces sp. NPDC056308]|uniref:NACHT domain-containing protein n=1 Tax=Streptomyces sp. NPDC056308 TaxID=3345780 RepID=UPI0035DF4C9B
MDYQYETLLDQRFQMLCQSLLLSEYENVKCFPVGKADGGRDATSHRGDSLETVFQVKFSHNPGTIKNVTKWITDTLEKEKEKIAKLKERGASRYVLITNVTPSANLDSGAIDKVDAYLSENLPMESICWWRNDLDRRLDVSYDLKLQYPSLLTGTDMLRLLWENIGSREDTDRRRMALNAYFAHQAEQDATIRFKQAELLPSSLLNLFVDVPAVPRGAGNDENASALFLGYADHFLRKSADSSDDDDRDAHYRLRQYVELGYFSPEHETRSSHLARFLDEAGASSGAADLLLDSAFTDQIPHVVLEGAPGQGKSTLSQYLAQLQRLRILNRHQELRRLPSGHVGSAVMMPFKIELRDLALWIKGEDPWAGTPHSGHSKPRTLEGALAAHVEKYSGGFEFDVADMGFVIQSRPVLVILDALDEVADLEDRHRVVEEVTTAVTRLRHNARSLKMLITSRPTAVSGAPSFSQSKFDYLTLSAIPTKLAIEYAEKWGKARNLVKADIDDISQTLHQKMSAPHMAELAKNTMQLSILLSLIYHRGPSLPDKRTELYDAYIGSFFNREVEKSAVVREHRALLFSIHQHLAYYMHAKAESDGTAGRISEDDLRQVVREYLISRKEPQDALDSLLTGVVERVVALVSRVEGTYEFEVQPLREYFAARYLYDTAPYVPATSMGYGTKPDRFNGIARNPYWMNVTRFFAGCFTSGELLDLAERVCALCDDPEMKGSFYPRSLALALLQDWVFAHSKVATERVLDKVFNEYGIRTSYLADSELSISPWETTSFDLSLSPKIGSTYLSEKFIPKLLSDIPNETNRALALLVGKQSDRDMQPLRDEWSDRYRGADKDRRIELIKLANWANLPLGYLDSSLFSDETDIAILLAILKSHGAKHLPVQLHRDIVIAALNSADQFGAFTGSDDLSQSLLATFPVVWHYARSHRFPPLLLGNRRAAISDDAGAIATTLYEIMRPLGDRKDFKTDLNAWRLHTAAMISEFGQTWNTNLIGLMSGSVRAGDERGAGADFLMDPNRSICDRVRNAKRRSKQPEWWAEQLQEISSDSDAELWIATAYCWASVDVLHGLWESMEGLLEALPTLSFARIAEMATYSGMITEGGQGICPVTPGVGWIRSVNLSSRMLAIFFSRIRDETQKDRILRKRVAKPLAPLLGVQAAEYAWTRFLAGAISEEEMFRFVKKFHTADVLSQRIAHRINSQKELRAMRPVLLRVVENSESLPDSLLASAEHMLRLTGRKSRPVLRTANKEKWFD